MSGLAAVGAGVGLFGSMANLFQQHKHREYQREFAENAAQIRARDLEAAGLSKTLAAGSPAQAPHGEAPQMNMETMYHGAKVGAEISHVKAQTDLLKAQAEQTRQSTFHSQDLHGYNINKIANEIVGIQYKNSGELISQERAVEELGDYLVHRVMRLEKASVDIQLVEAELKKVLSQVNINDLDAQKLAYDLSYFNRMRMPSSGIPGAASNLYRLFWSIIDRASGGQYGGRDE